MGVFINNFKIELNIFCFFMDFVLLEDIILERKCLKEFVCIIELCFL